MADTKYTMVGMSSAGKTCYITAMYKAMSQGVGGFTLITDETTRTKLDRDIRVLRQPMGQSRFPSATKEDSVRSYEFKLSYNSKKIISFEMMDYAGGVLESRQSTYDQIKRSIAESTALYIFIDGASFCTDDEEEQEENLYYDCAGVLHPIIQDFADTHGGSIPPIVFVVTKADLCIYYITTDRIVKLIKKMFSTAFSEGTYSYICAVSLGENISDDGYKGKFKPVNIHIPFFIGSYHEYYNRCLLLKKEIDSANKEYEYEINKQKLEAEKELRRWKLFRNESYIDSCLKAAKEAESDKNDNQAILDSTRKLFIKLGTRLETECENFKCFIDGHEKDFISFDF